MDRVFFSFVVTIVSLCCLENFTSAKSIVTVTKMSTKLFYIPCPKVKLQGNIVSVTFNGTLGPDGQTAYLHKGSYVGIDFSFVSNEKVSKLTSKVYGEVEPLPYVNFPLDNPDGCKDSGITCPFDAKTTQDLTTVLHIPSFIPSVGVFVKWELLNDNDKPIFCIVIPAKVES